MHDNFPQPPVLFIIRHPCAVVLSRLKLGWATDSDIAPILSQPHFITDFLSEKIDRIQRSETPEEKHAILWCLTNLVPLRQFSSDGLNLIFYENLCLKPEVEIPRIFQIVPHVYSPLVFNALKRPSTTTLRSSAIITGADKVNHWKSELSKKQIDNILSVVQDFGLDYLYGDSATPLSTVP
jgi:hypothetical protein